MRCSRTEVPSLHRHYPASLVLRTSPPPCRPNLTLAGCRLARATPPAGLPVLRPIPSSIHATANTPAEPVGARVARFPTAGSLPRFNGGSASALCVSRPARRLLALWPVWLLSRPRRPFVIGVLQTMLLPPPSAPIATDWSDSCRAGFAPAEDWRLLTAHAESVPIPVIACGGAGCLDHVRDVFLRTETSAVCLASMLHYSVLRRHETGAHTSSEGNTEYLKSQKVFSKVSDVSLEELKEFLVENGINCRTHRVPQLPTSSRR